MANAASLERQYTLDDGLGVRTVARHPAYGAVDVLEVTRVLTADAAVEQAIRARASRYALVDHSLLAAVRGIDRRGAALRIAADAPEGVRLSGLLADLEFGNETLSDATVLALAAVVIRAVALMHQQPGLVAHGAISPAHVVLTRTGTVVLTDGSFGGAFEALQWNRERLWREFGVALPMSASMHRFDQRTDVTQLAAVILAIVLRRQLRRDEYPRLAMDLVLQATPLDGGAPHASALRMWLQQALQLHPRAVLSSAVDAHHMFAHVIAAAGGSGRDGMQPVRTIVEKACGERAFSNHRAS